MRARIPSASRGMVLRGVFLASRAEVQWYLDGLRHFLPEAWEALAQGEGDGMLERYHALVNEPDERAALDAARRWIAYEDASMSLGAGGEAAGAAPALADALARARVQLHYLAHECFLEPGVLLSGVSVPGGGTDADRSGPG